MADGYEVVELKQLNAEVLMNPDQFTNWEKLVTAAEGLEGGVNRNSSPQCIAALRDIYDRLLAKFPLFFGYWKKYADREFAIGGTEAAEMVYERGVASISVSADLWKDYCAFKVDTNHDQDAVRELFERGAASVGLDFLAHPFWDKYIEFEERFDAQDKVFAILSRIINIPLHQYARYFERYRQMAAHRPVSELAPEELLIRFRDELDLTGQSAVDADRALRTRIDNYHLDIFHHTQAETTKRWTFEQELKRPYFHVTPLEASELENWQKYLDFEEGEGDYTRTSFLYERCLVTCAQHEEFWERFARWMYSQDGKEEEVRNIFQRASCLYTPIASPEIRLKWAMFEEMTDRPTVAYAIYEAILLALPDHLEALVGLANLQFRQSGYDAAVQVYRQYINSDECPNETKGAIVAELARLAWKDKGSVDEARSIFQSQKSSHPDSQLFWAGYLAFEMEQPKTVQTSTKQYELVKAVHNEICGSRLAPEIVKELSHQYMHYLTTRRDKAAAKEYMDLDAEVNGPASIVPIMRNRRAVATKAMPAAPQAVSTNGHTTS
ncbi:hypothetical protein MBLNU459_g3802t2 [Dothideomycetes sp. NU459]